METSGSFLDKQRLIGDPQADRLLETVVKSDALSSFHHTLSCARPALEKLAQQDVVAAFLLDKEPDPSWFDADRIARGQLMFEEHAFPIMTLLGLMSLPYCYAASPGNKVLFMAEKMRKSPAKRINDTAQFTIDVLRPGNLKRGGSGLLQIRRTRLIHAMARHYIGKGQWDKRWGLPVNQEDMAGTNLAFSYITLMGLETFGVALPMQAKEDFIFTWKYIGHQLGIDPRLLPDNVKDAAILTDILKHRNFRKTEEGVILTKELVKYFKTIVSYQQSYFVEAQIKYFVGNEVSAYLGLPGNRIKERIVEATNSVKSIQNFFTIPRKSLNRLLRNHDDALHVT